ncbi:MAG: AAA family ATPase, partial [Pseudomonadota bacterium]
MRFTRLRLNGFKSFVDPTDLMIAEGLTGVVGPNGCGKSNLLEALRWVMGESRPTAMRGGGMDDVIFAGAATRPARAFAEVALTIDNRERLAPAAFNTEDTLEIARRITRDAGSAYKVGGKDMRARDVQMLFADAATGAHSTALVRQGQVAEIINAKPRARRRVLEEAAGISGLYQRRHEAELKLNAADVNLARVGDMIESLAARIQSLARQARQARRYREIAADLRRAEGLLLYLRWLAADRARADADAAMGLAETAASQAQRQVRSAATARSEAEASMPDLREEATIAGAVMNRVQIESATLADEAKRVDAAIAGLAAQIAELDRNMARERDLAGDAEANIARLDAEAADLATAETGAVAQLADIEAAAEAAGQALATREADLSAITDAHARHVARAQAAEARLAEAQEAARRGRIAAAQAKEAADDTASRLSASAEGADAARSALAAAQAQAEAAEAALRAADAARIQAATQEAEARAARTEAEGHAKALDTEVRALSQLLEAGRGQESKIIDAVEVAPGYEAALGAALGDDLDAPPARHAGGIGWSALPAYVPQPALPKGVVALSQFVSGPDALSRRLGQIGVVAAEDGAALQPALSPGQRLVSRAGDLWRWDGFAKAAADAGSDVG